MTGTAPAAAPKAAVSYLSSPAAPIQNDYGDLDAPLPKIWYPPTLATVNALGLRLSAVGIDPGVGFGAAQVAADALLAASAVDPGSARLGLTLMSLTETQLLQELHTAATEAVTYQELRLQVTKFEDQLGVEAATALAVESDRMILAMRSSFDAALATVTTAKDAGVTSDMTADDVIVLGGAAVAAYSALPAAVAVLDELAGIREDLAWLLGVGPRDYLAAGWLEVAPNLLDIVAAKGIADGQVEWAQHTGYPFGAYMSKVRVRRVGGAWLALVIAGHVLHLNTGTEADALLAAAAV